MQTPEATWILVQARTGSSRLPGKALLELGGRPLLERLLERLQRTGGVEGVLLATTERPEDDALEAIAAGCGVRCFRGAEQDVLGRLRDAARSVDAMTVVRVCADNPLTNPESVELCIGQYFERRLDYLHSFQDVQLPYGTGAAVFSRELLERAADESKDAADREHVEPWMLRAEGVRRAALEAPEQLRRPEVHLSVDYPSDYEKVKRIFEACFRQDAAFGTDAVLRYLNHCPLVVCANGALGLELVRWLVARGEEIRGLVVHPAHQSSHRSAIVEASGLAREDVISPGDFKQPWLHAWFRERDPQLVASFWSSYIFPRPLIELPERGIVNLHNSLLPWCGGSGANVWTILDGCPSGVTLHYVAERVDKGPIIATREVLLEPIDTGRTLFLKQEAALIELFKEHWPAVRVGPVRTRAQEGGGSFHLRRAADERRRIDLDRPTTAREVLDQLRAFSYPPHEGAWFEDGEGRRVVLNLELSYGITTVRRKRKEG